MANDLRFGVQIDLEQAIKEASGNADKYLRRLQDALNKRAINVRVNLGGSTRGSSTELVGFKKQLAELTQQWNALTAAERGGAKGAAIREKFRALRLEAQGYTSTLQAAVNAEDKLHKTQNKTAASTRNLGKEYHTTSTYLSRLIQRLAVYAGFQQIMGFLRNVREVTAQFELQRVSLGAIIQDQNKANTLFTQIKGLALNSPVSILDLTKYTKQLAAYKIGYDELFETTKRLTDVSVGLGVSMDRIVLLYGQVRATGYLRASEVRQATEAGIPLVEELAAKLTKANGELVKASDVMDMISKREIPFEMVKEVFEDMTDKGGIFYNMQEKQGNTLYGLWRKLGDAASVMYDEIGNTDSVNAGMKWLIRTLTFLMRQWKSTGIAIAAALAALSSWRLSVSASNMAVAHQTAQHIAYVAALRQEVATQNAATYAGKKWNIVARLNLWAKKQSTTATLQAATANNVLTKSFYGLKAAMLSNPWTLIIGILASVVGYVMMLEDETEKLTKSIEEIDAHYATTAQQSKDRFVELAEAATNNADGSTKQKEALEELARVYRDMFHAETLELDNLKNLKGAYGELTDQIEAYYAKQRYEEKREAIKSNIAGQYKKIKENIKHQLEINDADESYIAEALSKIDEAWIDGGDIKAVVSKIYSDAGVSAGKAFVGSAKKAYSSAFDAFKEALKGNWEEALGDAAQAALRNPAGVVGLGVAGYESYDSSIDYASQLNEVLALQNKLLGENEQQYKNSLATTNEYLKTLQKYDEYLGKKKYGELLVNGAPITFDRGNTENLYMNTYMTKGLSEFEAANEEYNARFQDWVNILLAQMNKADIDIKEEWFAMQKSVKDGGEGLSMIATEAIEDAIKNSGNTDLLVFWVEWKKRVDALGSSIDAASAAANNRIMSMAKAAGASSKFTHKVLKKSEEDWKTYKERVSGEVDGLQQKIRELRVAMSELGDNPLASIYRLIYKKKLEQSEKDLKAGQAALREATLRVPDKANKGKGGRTKSDPRLQILNEMVQLAEKLNKEYSDWEKKVGSTKALEKVNATYKETVKYAEQVAKKAGIKLPHLETPTNAKELNEYLESVRKVMETAKGLKGGKKAAIELAVKQSNNISAEDQKAIEEKIKALADRISRTKTAKEFYDKILSQTGDIQLAATLSFAVHGEDGKALKKQIIENIDQVLKSGTSGEGIDFSAAIRSDGTVDYDELMRIVDAYKAVKDVGEDAYNKIAKMRDEDRKDLGKTVEGWLKATEKAKSYSDKLISLAQTTNAEIARINTRKGYAQTRVTELLGMGNLTDNEQKELTELQNFLSVAETLIQRFKDKQAQEEVKLGFEAFKDSPMYVQMFDDLDHASTKMLENMHTRITSMQMAWKDLDPTQLKELQSRLNEIDEQLVKRNPFSALVKGITDYRNLMKNGDVRGNRSAGEAEQDLMDTAKRADEANKAFDDALKKYAVGSETFDELITRYKQQQMALPQDLADAKKELDDAMRDEKAAQKAVENWKKVEKAIKLSATELFSMLNWSGDIASAIADISEAMGADEEDVQYWNDISTALNDVAGGIQDIVQSAMSSNVIGIVSSALTAVPKMFSGFVGLFSAGKVRRANKEIKRQQELLDQLDYAYGRLQDASDKLFGRDYLNNYNQQIKNLEAQQQAYLKQAEAERSKGKKADKEKIKEYENQARDTADELKKLQEDFVSQIVGTDVASAARDFAQAWLDAYLSFSSTTGAIKEKFDDMIKNMIVNMVLAQVVKNALQPIFDMIDELAKDGELSADDIATVMQQVPATMTQINDGLSVGMKSLEKAGVDISKLRDGSEEFSGIAKNVASASSEEINNVAAIGNTLMYYVSPIPRMDENLAAIRAIMERTSPTAIPETSAAGWTDWQQQAMDAYTAIQRNTADTVVECRNIAAQCKAMADDIHRVVKPKGTSTTYGVHVYM